MSLADKKWRVVASISGQDLPVMSDLTYREGEIAAICLRHVFSCIYPYGKGEGTRLDEVLGFSARVDRMEE